MKESHPQEIGRYKILERIGKGGMGEVFLAYDPISERNVALKCIREDLQGKKAIRSRFLREARIASQLTHPSVIPIYSIHKEGNALYYTMPYLQGKTLRQVLRETKEQAKQGAACSLGGGSISSLFQVFLRICEGVSYTHAKTILHRDLKPENVIIGKYGEVMILDWGIADYAKAQRRGTKTGKVAGTVAYMAPERALGEKATYQTDIYSLGVILYHMVTLELPFQRGNLEAFRKYMKEETYVNPIELAPYREIPHEILDIIKKCLSFDPEDRYRAVHTLIQDMQHTIQGKTHWMFITQLCPEKKSDWEFQEHVMIAKHTAITRHTEIAQWAMLMVSKHNFSGNIRLHVTVQMLEKSAGFGVLFGIPESPKRNNLGEGYCLWITKSPTRLQLFRSNVLVVDIEPHVEEHAIHEIVIEKVHEQIRCFLHNTLVFSYTLSLPLHGAHVGILYKDAHFVLKHFSLYSGSQGVLVNCLAIPDAFFAYQDYDKALLEYRRAGRAFPGRPEGRDAIFKAGITLLEKAKLAAEDPKPLQLEALDEFEALHGTPGAPLEYLGKALAYRALGDYHEEAKCLEFALNKFPKHPLLPLLEEHIFYRMHESSTENRLAAYKSILLVVRYFPKMLENSEVKLLIGSLKNHWQTLPFIEGAAEDSQQTTAIILAFWTDTKQALLSSISTLIKQEAPKASLLENALFCLSELGYYSDTRHCLEELKNASKSALLSRGCALIKGTILKEDSAIKTVYSYTEGELDFQQIRVLVHIVKKLLLRKEYGKLQQIARKTPLTRTSEQIMPLHAALLWFFLLDNQINNARKLLQAYTLEELKQEQSPLFSPYGTFLFRTRGKGAMDAHFGACLEKSSPPTTCLLSHFLRGKIAEEGDWMRNAFYWEKQELFLELTLLYRITNQHHKAKDYEQRLQGRYTRDYRKEIRP